MLTWLREALREVAPEMADGVIVPRGLDVDADPEWSAATAVVGGEFVVKFAWAEPAARRIRHQVRVLEALRVAAPRLPLPVVVKASTDPALLVTRREPAVPFFDVRHLVTPAVAGDLATVLVDLHDPGVLTAVRAAIGPLPAAVAPGPDPRYELVAGPGRRERVRSWCDWADGVLARPGRQVLVHGDFHGDNHLWDSESLRLRLIVDLETVGVGEPEFDMRCLPGDCGAELFLATVAEYERLSGTAVDVDRVLAWHVRTVLADALWRTEAGVALPGGRTPEQWIDDLEARLPM
ncbi:aminoglycoside phosphotransferase family protein [Actinoplanes sp. NPDC049596]|uniref:phosphotransferase family protein n=1 Tax=unclassified Actinoplanes TaxID=2626549 RepID=UPI0034433182